MKATGSPAARAVPRTSSPARRAVLCIAACAVISCVPSPLVSPTETSSEVVPMLVGQNIRDKVDLLFMVDNSASMQPMSDELHRRFPQLIQEFADLAQGGTYLDLQIGVVTSDYGAGDGGASGCDPSPGGQRGQLQALGVLAASTCKRPTGGVNFVQYKYQAVGDGPNNLPPGQSLIDTFTCMASVGTHGCGFEHPLESVYAALHNDLPENAGFLRPDALLVVVFVTNEDDASAPPDVKVFDAAEATFFEDTYRQTQYGVVCGGSSTTTPAPPPYASSNGPLADCVPAPNPGGAGPGVEYDVNRYIDFFTHPIALGGVKTDPSDVILIGIDAPAAPFSIVLTDPTASAPSQPACATYAAGTCVPMLKHSCVNAADPGFFGDPAVRLDAVINAAANHALSSICEDNFSDALHAVAEEVSTHLDPGCIGNRFPRDADGQLVIDCVVEQESPAEVGSDHAAITETPQCNDSDGGDGGAQVFPCWRVGPIADCATRSPDGVGITIDRDGQSAPPDTVARISCAVLP